MRSALQRFEKCRTKDIRALDRISFALNARRNCGFYRPSGTGKTTILKILLELLHPKSGKTNVLGFTPLKREKYVLHQITQVMGQRNQLVCDIPSMDSSLP